MMSHRFLNSLINIDTPYLGEEEEAMKLQLEVLDTIKFTAGDKDDLLVLNTTVDILLQKEMHQK